MVRADKVRAIALLWVVVAIAILVAGVAPAAAHRVERPRQVNLQLLAVNDLHGALDSSLTGKVGGRPVGGAAVLAGYLDKYTAAADALGVETLRLGGGDLIGASQPVSALLKEEPTINVLNAMHLDASVVGNHEFDKGLPELRRLMGRDEERGDHRGHKCGGFQGADWPYLGANVVSTATGHHVLRPYVVERVDGVRVAIIGVILRSAPSIISPTAVQGLSFLDEATTVNKYVHRLQHQGIHAFVVLLHQGGFWDSKAGAITGDVVPVVQAMDKDVDVVVSAHTHAGYQGMIDGKLVTEAYANGTAFADIDLTIDRRTDDIVSKSAQIVTTYSDAAAGLTPNAAVAKIVNDALAQVAPITNQVVGTAAVKISKTQNAAGESPMGDLIADAQRAKMGTQIAFMNPGGVRAELEVGPVTWGALFTTQPFSNFVMTMKMTGQQIHDVLEQQWYGQPASYVDGRVLQVSGISYTWTKSMPLNDRVDPANVFVGGVKLDLGASYTVAANNYIAAGGDNFAAFKSATEQVMGPVDIDVLVEYVKGLTSPFGLPTDGRIIVAS